MILVRTGFALMGFAVSTQCAPTGPEGLLAGFLPG